MIFMPVTAPVFNQYLTLLLTLFTYNAVWLSGLVQTGLYADFFYYYFRSWQNNEKLSLPQ